MNMEVFDNTVKGYLSFLDNEYVSAGLALFLVLYASLAAPKLPASVAHLFDNLLFKLLVFFLIVYVSRKNVTIAIIASVAVMVSLMTLNKLKFLQETMEGGVVADDSEELTTLTGCKCACPKQFVSPDLYNSVSSDSSEVQPYGDELVNEEVDYLGRTHDDSHHEEDSHSENVSHSETKTGEDHPLVHEVVQEKAKQEEALGRQLTKEEVKQLCDNHAKNKEDGDVEGFSGSLSYSRLF